MNVANNRFLVERIVLTFWIASRFWFRIGSAFTFKGLRMIGAFTLLPCLSRATSDANHFDHGTKQRLSTAGGIHQVKRFGTSQQRSTSYGHTRMEGRRHEVPCTEN